MTQNQIKVTFQPQGSTVYVLPGTKIIEAAAIAGIIIDTPCGGEGTCSKCKVKILQPQQKQGDCLSCRQEIAEDTVIEVPQDSLLLGLDKIVVDSNIVQEIIPDKRCEKVGKCYGIAVDIGTTTIAASLVNLKDGAEIAITGSINPQISFGDDVISRIKHAASGQKALAEMQKAVVRQINAMIENLCGQGTVNKNDIYEITIAGNTTMEHLVCGIDPAPLGQLPFEPSWRGANAINASELKFNINYHGKVYVFPIIGGFVGGDITAGLLASDILNQPQPVLFIDIGTNGEIVLVKDGKILAASTAAGPAFEGSRISCGTRAATGAIEKVKFNDDCEFGIIGNVEPTGICGSGLIDITAELLNAGIVDSTGRMIQPSNIPQKIAQRVVIDKNNQPAFVIHKKLKITQKDIRQIQLAVGAIRAGISIILKKAGIKASDLKKVLIAGGFGSFIRRNHAQRIGLLPADVSHEKISFIGNSSLAGAKLALLSIIARQKAQTIASQTQHIELSIDSDFQNEFASAMIFPA